jgi:hypothetical protein
VAATSTRSVRRLVCDACGSAIEPGAAHGHGLYLSVHGDHVVREEPPLCENCALSIGMTFLVRLAAEEEEG